MTPEEAAFLAPGHRVSIDPTWNRLDPLRAIDRPTTVVETKRAVGCQTGVMVTVISQRGKRLEIDAGWFKRVTP